MDKIEVKFKKLVAWAKLPEYETRGAVGCDLAIAIQEEIVLYPNEVRSLPTGFAMMLPGFLLQFCMACGNRHKKLLFWREFQ